MSIKDRGVAIRYNNTQLHVGPLVRALAACGPLVRARVCAMALMRQLLYTVSMFS